MSEVYLGVTMSDGSLVHLAFQTMVRTPRGVLTREATADNIEAELARYLHLWWPVTVVTWRPLTQVEHELVSRDRPGEGSLYRNALVDRDGQVQYDLPKARELHRARMRRARVPLFTALDVAYQRADEGGLEAPALRTALIAQKQALRDVTDDPAIDAATTVEELQAVWPAALTP